MLAVEETSSSMCFCALKTNDSGRFCHVPSLTKIIVCHPITKATYASVHISAIKTVILKNRMKRTGGKDYPRVTKLTRSMNETVMAAKGYTVTWSKIRKRSL